MSAGQPVRLVDLVLGGIVQEGVSPTRLSRVAGGHPAIRDGKGLIDACDDACLLGLELWPRQRELLSDVQQTREQVWALGRRSGKSTMAVLVWDALLRPELASFLRAGERRYSVVVATNLPQARLVLRTARSLVEQSAVLAPLIESVTDDEIVFVNGSVILALPCSGRGSRGRPVSALVFDEAAHFVDTEGNASLASVWQALVPSCAQFGDQSRVIVSSTPWGSEGFFADRFRRAANGEIPGAAARQFGTAEMNPTIDRAFLEAESASDPELFRSEYGAEFVGGGGQYLDPQVIERAATLPQELAPEHGSNWVAGLDPAFSRDPFGLVIVGQPVDDWRRLVVGCVRAWKPSPGGTGSFEELRSTASPCATTTPRDAASRSARTR